MRESVPSDKASNARHCYAKVVRLTDQLAQILDEADYMKEREVSGWLLKYNNIGILKSVTSVVCRWSFTT